MVTVYTRGSDLAYQLLADLNPSVFYKKLVTHTHTHTHNRDCTEQSIDLIILYTNIRVCVCLSSHVDSTVCPECSVGCRGVSPSAILQHIHVLWLSLTPKELPKLTEAYCLFGFILHFHFTYNFRDFQQNFALKHITKLCVLLPCSWSCPNIPGLIYIVSTIHASNFSIHGEAE